MKLRGRKARREAARKAAEAPATAVTPEVVAPVATPEVIAAVAEAPKAEAPATSVPSVPWPEPKLGAYMGQYCLAAFASARQTMHDEAARTLAMSLATWEGARGLMALLSRPVREKLGKRKSGKGSLREPLSIDDHLALLGITVEDIPRIKFMNECQETWRRSAEQVRIHFGAVLGPMPEDFPAKFKARIEAEAAAAVAAATAENALAAVAREAVTAKPEAAAIPQSTALVPVSPGVVLAVASLDAKAEASPTETSPEPSPEPRSATDAGTDALVASPTEATPEPRADSGELPAPETAPEVIRPVDDPDMTARIAAAHAELDTGAGDASASTEAEAEATADPLAGDTPTEAAPTEATSETAPTSEAVPATGDLAPTEPAPEVAPEGGDKSPPADAPEASPNGGGHTSTSDVGPVLAGDAAPAADSACTGEAPEAHAAHDGDAKCDACEPAAVTEPIAAPAEVAAIAAPLVAGPEATAEADTSSDTGQGEPAASPGEPAGDTTAPDAGNVAPEAVTAEAGSEGGEVPPAVLSDPLTSAVAGKADADASLAGQAASDGGEPQAGAGIATSGHASETAPEVLAPIASGPEVAAIAPLKSDAADVPSCGGIQDIGATPEGGAASTHSAATAVAGDEPDPIGGVAPDAGAIATVTPGAVGSGDASHGEEGPAPGTEPPAPRGEPDVCDGKMFADKTPAEQAAARARLNRRLGLDADAGSGEGSKPSALPVQDAPVSPGTGGTLGEMKARVERNLSIAKAAYDTTPSEATARHYRTIVRQMARECPQFCNPADIQSVKEYTFLHIPQGNKSREADRLAKLAAAQAMRPGYAAAAVAEVTETPAQANAMAMGVAARSALLGNAAEAGVAVPDDVQ